MLIVDEVDGLIVDEDVNRAYVYEDKRASLALTQALQRRGKRGREPLRDMLAGHNAALAEAVQEAETCAPRELVAVRSSVLG